MGPRLRELILSILAAGREMTVATVCEDGWPYASTVSYASDGFRIYFGCSAGSLKALNIKQDPRVSVTITLPYGAWTEIRGLCLAARARLLNDPEEITKASALFETKFPRLEDYVAGPLQAIRLFELTPTLVSALDYSKGFGHTEHARLELFTEPDRRAAAGADHR